MQTFSASNRYRYDFYYSDLYFLLIDGFHTVPIYDGTNHQLKVPNELRKVPDILPRYVGHIPDHSLALVAYTVSMYSSTSGPRQDQVTTPLHIHFAVVLHTPNFELDIEELSD